MKKSDRMSDYAPSGVFIWVAIFLGLLALGAYLPKPCAVYPLECVGLTPP